MKFTSEVPNTQAFLLSYRLRILSYDKVINVSDGQIGTCVWWPSNPEWRSWKASFAGPENIHVPIMLIRDISFNYFTTGAYTPHLHDSSVDFEIRGLICCSSLPTWLASGIHEMSTHLGPPLSSFFWSSLNNTIAGLFSGSFDGIESKPVASDSPFAFPIPPAAANNKPTQHGFQTHL